MNITHYKWAFTITCTNTWLTPHIITDRVFEGLVPNQFQNDSNFESPVIPYSGPLYRSSHVMGHIYARWSCKCLFIIKVSVKNICNFEMWKIFRKLSLRNFHISNLNIRFIPKSIVSEVQLCITRTENTPKMCFCNFMSIHYRKICSALRNF